MFLAIWAMAISYSPSNPPNCSNIEEINSHTTKFFVRSLKKADSFCIEIKSQGSKFRGYYGTFIFNSWDGIKASAYYTPSLVSEYSEVIIEKNNRNQGFSFGKNYGIMKFEALEDTIINIAASTFDSSCQVKYALRQSNELYNMDTNLKNSVCWFNGAPNKQTVGFLSNRTANGCRYKIIPSVKTWTTPPLYNFESYYLPQSNPGLAITRCTASVRRSKSIIQFNSKSHNLEPVLSFIGDSPLILTASWHLTGGQIAGIVIGSVVGGILVIFLIAYLCCCCLCDDCSDEVNECCAECCHAIWCFAWIHKCNCVPDRCQRRTVIEYSYSDDRPPVAPTEVISSPYQ